MKIHVLPVLLIVAALNPLLHAQTAPPMPPEKVAVVWGQNIHYYETGQGPVVILLHGLGASGESWSPVIDSLSARYHIYALDQIGFGHSDKPLLDYKIATFVDFLYGFMQSQKIAKATLVGNSLGGWIAAAFAIQHAEQMDKLVLVDAAGLPFGHAITVDLNPSYLAGTRTLLESIFYNKQIVTDEFVQYVFAKHLHDNDGYTVRSTLTGFAYDQFVGAKLGSIHAPTLVLWGKEDELTPVDGATQFQKGIPGAKIAIIEQCGHVPQLEKPAEFSRILLDFLQH